MAQEPRPANAADRSAQAPAGPQAAAQGDANDELRRLQKGTRDVANVLEQGVEGAKQSVQFVSNLKSQMLVTGFSAAGRAIVATHVLDGAGPVIQHAARGLDSALKPMSGDLQNIAGATRQVADIAEKVVTVTKIKDVAEIVGALEDVNSLKTVGGGALKKAVDAAPVAARVIEQQAARLPFKEPPRQIKLVVAPEQAPVKLVVAAPQVEVETAIDASMVKSAQPAVSTFDTTYRLKQGNFGEKMAADALAQQGHDIMYFKPDIKGANQGGIDMVTMKDGVVYAVDNKAYATGKNVSSVSALDKNYAKNIATMRAEFAAAANDPSRYAFERAKFSQAVDAIDNGRVQKLVTTAAWAPDGKSSAGITLKLQNKGFQHQDLGPQHNQPGGPALPSRSEHFGGGAPERPQATQTAPPPPTVLKITPRPEAVLVAPKPQVGAGGLAPRPPATAPAPLVQPLGGSGASQGSGIGGSPGGGGAQPGQLGGGAQPSPLWRGPSGGANSGGL